MFRGGPRFFEVRTRASVAGLVVPVRRRLLKRCLEAPFAGMMLAVAAGPSVVLDTGGLCLQRPVMPGDRPRSLDVVAVDWKS